VRFVRFFTLKVLRRTIGFEVLCLYRGDVESGPHAAADGNIGVRTASNDDLREIESLRSERPSGWVKDRISLGESCFVARTRGGDLCGYLWAAPGPRIFRHRGKEIRIAQGDVYVRDGQTLPAYRGRGIMPQLIASARATLLGQEKRWMWAAIYDFNDSPKRSVEKAGFQLHEKICYVSVPFAGRALFCSRKQKPAV